MRDTPVCCDLSRPPNPASPREEVTGFDPTEGSLEEMRASVSLDIEHSAKVINPYRTLSGALGDPRHQRVGEVCAQVGRGTDARIRRKQWTILMVSSWLRHEYASVEVAFQSSQIIKYKLSN